MMVIYLPVKFEFDWSNRFKVRVRKRKMWTDRRTDRQTDVGHINLMGGLVTRNPPKNSPRLLPKPAKFEKNLPNGYRVIRKTKCGAGGA